MNLAFCWAVCGPEQGWLHPHGEASWEALAALLMPLCVGVKARIALLRDPSAFKTN